MSNQTEWTVIAEVQGSAKKPYRVSYNDKQFGCGCPAWTKSAASRTNCKHITRVLAVLNGESNYSVSLLPEGKELKKVIALLD